MTKLFDWAPIGDPRSRKVVEKEKQKPKQKHFTPPGVPFN